MNAGIWNWNLFTHLIVCRHFRNGSRISNEAVEHLLCHSTWKENVKKKRRILGFPVSVSIIFMGSLISASASECPLFSFIFSASISAYLDERAATQNLKITRHLMARLQNRNVTLMNWRPSHKKPLVNFLIESNIQPQKHREKHKKDSNKKLDNFNINFLSKKQMFTASFNPTIKLGLGNQLRG